VRNNTDLVLDGKHIESNLFGYYHLKGNQHVDNHTNINHIKPNCDSNELFKGILEDKARGVFSGTIYVARDAQKTNAFQSNKNLLLSNQAEIDTKPQLKIFADDVKCSHGATIGELDEESIFYLQQRGIGKTDAEALLRAAFAGEVTSKIRHESVRIQVENLINKRLQK
jgi:Fe-S cluster assembly protein SufD